MDELNVMYQVSTLQALSMGYTRTVIRVKELLGHGNTGLGTFENVDGEMILLDGHCYRADADGFISTVPESTGVPFASVTFLQTERQESLPPMRDIEELKRWLDARIEEGFGLNSMHMVRIDGSFAEVRARSEEPYRSQHITLKTILEKTQKDFLFRSIRGTLVCVYYPPYMDGINASGWHLHFVSADRQRGGHVFQLELTEGTAVLDKIQRLEIRLPSEPAFDTYTLENASDAEIRQVEQGQK